MSSGTNKERITQNNTLIGTNNSSIDAIKTAINNLPSTGNTTATAGDLLYGKTAVSKGATITGTLGTESKTVKSTTTQQTITPTDGKLINEIIVSPLNLFSTGDTYTENGTYYITKGVFDGISQVEINVNVPQSTGGSVPSNKVRYYADAQSRQQAINQEYLNIGDIGVILENMQEVVIQDNSSQNYFAFKFEEKIDVNYLGGDPSQVGAYSGVFEPYNNYNAQITEANLTSQYDLVDLGQPAIFDLHFSYNNENYILQAEYTYDSQTGYINRQSVQITNSSNEVVASVDGSGYIFLPFKFHTGNDFTQFEGSWFFDSGIVKGMYANSMREPMMFDGQNWTTNINI